MRTSSRLRDFVNTYTRDLKAQDLQRLFTRDAREAYEFFARQIDEKELQGLPWHRRAIAHLRLFFTAFTMKLSPARRIVYAASLLFAAIGFFNLLRLGMNQAQAQVGNVNPTFSMPDGLL